MLVSAGESGLDAVEEENKSYAVCGLQ